MRYPIALAAIGSLVTGCGTPRESKVIPSEVTFTIVKEDKIPGAKRSLDIRLNKKVSEEVLRAIALKLKAQDAGAYERTFIAYYLPEMTIGTGAWATTHFNPDLEIRILGLGVEAENKALNPPEPAHREIIGRDERPFVANRISIFREGGKLFIERTFKDGSSLKKELAEKNSPLGRRFDDVDGSDAGDHFVIATDGNLQIRDNDGLITAARKVE